MKTVIQHLITLALLALVPAVLFAQQVPNTFQNNTVIYAEEINENFEFLASKLGSSQATVDCTSGATADPDNGVYTSIATALARHDHLKISGTCVENVKVDFAETRQLHVILEGTESNRAATIEAADDSKDLLHLANGAVTLIVRNLTLKGGFNGIRTFPSGGMVFVREVNILNQARHGVEASGGAKLIMANVDLSNYGTVTYEDSWWPPRGVLINNNSHARLDNLTLTNPNTNARDGIVISGSSSAEINGIDVRNHECGIRVWGSHLDLHNVNDSGLDQYEPREGQPSTLAENLHGVCIEGASHAWIVNINIHENTRHGVVVGFNSTAYIMGNTIRNNGSNGIHARDGGQVNLAGGNKIYANGKNGIRLGDGSQLDVPCQDDENRSVFFTQSNGSDANSEDALHLNGRNATAALCGDDNGGLDLSYHRHGIYANLGAGIAAKGVTIKHSREDGVYLKGAKLEMYDSTVDENGGQGIRVDNGYLDIHNTTIRNNEDHGLRISEASTVSLDDTEVSENGEHGINITKASTLDAWDTTIENNTKWGIWSGYGAILDLGNVTIRGHQSGLHLVDKVSASVNNVTIENNQWTGANTGNTYDDNVFMALGSTLHFQGSASDLEQVNCTTRTDNVSGTVYNMPISYLFERGNTGLALQSIREDENGNKRTNCPVFGWGEGEPRVAQ